MFLCLVEERENVVGLALGLAHHILAGFDEVAENGLPLNDFGVVLDVESGGNLACDLNEVIFVAETGEVGALPKGFADGDDVGFDLLVVEAADDTEDFLMDGTIKIFVFEEVEGLDDRFTVDQHAAQYRGLGFEAVRRGRIDDESLFRRLGRCHDTPQGTDYA